jgi:hypothetical protein
MVSILEELDVLIMYEKQIVFNIVTSTKTTPVYSSTKEIRKPNNLIEKIIVWFINKLGLVVDKTIIADYKTTYHKKVLNSNDISSINKQVLSFMQTGMIENPTKELVIMIGNTDFSNILQTDSVRSIYCDGIFSTPNQYTYRNIPIVAVPYINGTIVIRRKDLL